MRGVAAIAGVGETPYSRFSGVSESVLAMRAIAAALDDAGIAPSEVDGIVPNYNAAPVEEVIGSFGMRGEMFSAVVHMGGASSVASLGLAAGAIAAGLAEVIVLYIARNGRSGARIAGRLGGLAGQPFRAQLEHPHGWSTPAQWYAMLCRRHMHEFGTTKDQMADVAIAMRDHAGRNPRAMLCGTPLTREGYHAAAMIADPYQRYDCCLESDGGAAIVMTTPDRARRSGRAPAMLLGCADARPESADDIVNRTDWMSIGLTSAAPRAFEMAGVGPEAMDGAMIYDCFTFEVIHQLEEAGFCRRGEGGAFVADGAIGPGGRFPVNTHGGLLAESHMGAMNHVIEAVRQLRGEAGERQIANCRFLAVTGWGDMGDGAMAVLGNPHG